MMLKKIRLRLNTTRDSCNSWPPAMLVMSNVMVLNAKTPDELIREMAVHGDIMNIIPTICMALMADIITAVLSGLHLALTSIKPKARMPIHINGLNGIEPTTV